MFKTISPISLAYSATLFTFSTIFLILKISSSSFLIFKLPNILFSYFWILFALSNAEKIINSLPKDEKIIFAPDKYLGAYLQKKTGRDLLLWDGSCQVHEIFSERELIRLKTRHPEALVLAHPECDENILRHSDYIGSTTSIIKFAHDSKLEKFIIATEPGVIHQMEKESPQKTFIPLPSNDGCACNECPHMRLNTIEKMVTALETMEPEIILSEELRLQALAPLERMLALS